MCWPTEARVLCSQSPCVNTTGICEGIHRCGKRATNQNPPCNTYKSKAVETLQAILGTQLCGDCWLIRYGSVRGSPLHPGPGERGSPLHPGPGERGGNTGSYYGTTPGRSMGNGPGVIVNVNVNVNVDPITHGNPNVSNIGTHCRPDHAQGPNRSVLPFSHNGYPHFNSGVNINPSNPAGDIQNRHHRRCPNPHVSPNTANYDTYVFILDSAGVFSNAGVRRNAMSGPSHPWQL